MQQLASFSPISKVWIYQSTRPFTHEEVDILNNKLNAFAVQWTAHNKQLLAAGRVVEDRFIMLMVDETHTSASGCSIDTSVHFIKSLEKEFNIELFNRTIINYQSSQGISTISLSELQEQLQNGTITPDTIVYDPLVQTKQTFDSGFKTKLAETWMQNFI